MTEPKTVCLCDVAPMEFMGTEYVNSRAQQFLNVPVRAYYSAYEDGSRRCGMVVAKWRNWPGTHKHVNVWWLLENGYAVGWNENPSRGWSFPVVKVETAINTRHQDTAEHAN